MLCIYRISDFGQTSAIKPKLPSATKQRCLEEFIQVFGKDSLIVIADCVTERTYQELCEIMGSKAHMIVRTDFQSGAFSFLAAVQLAIDSNMPKDTPVYLCEDDYLHKPNAKELIMEGLTVGDYVSVYDHPDKYLANNIKPSRIYLTKSTHWRTAESTTMTFAARLSTLYEDNDTYVEFCKTGYPFDHDMFLKLGANGRKLVTCMPGASTHAEVAWLSPLVEWK